MKIVFLCRSLEYGGTERQLVTLAKGLQQSEDFEVCVFVFYAGGALYQELESAEVQLTSLGKRGRWDVFGFIIRLIRALRKEQPDVVYSFLDTANVISTLLRPATGRARLIWGVRSSYVDWQRYDWLARRTYTLSARLSRFADAVIVNSQAGRRFHTEQGYPKESTVVIPNGVDVRSFCIDPGARATARREWKVAEDELLIGTVGRLDPMKDHPNFIRAAAIFTEQYGNVRFVCVGDGESDYVAGLKQLVSELNIQNRLIWTGYRHDLVNVYNALDIVTLSSYGEGFPNVVAEAMACGRPCVVTDVGDCAWLVGKTGIVVPARDEVALAGGWEKMMGRLATDREAIGRNARDRIKEHFDSTLLVERTETVMRQVVAGAPISANSFV